MAEEPQAPKIFVSYSWTTPGHEEGVLTLSRELSDRGIHVILDKWDLSESQDALTNARACLTLIGDI